MFLTQLYPIEKAKQTTTTTHHRHRSIPIPGSLAHPVLDASDAAVSDPKSYR
jgi:hypothetical protein